jgi:hypothetical protein
MLKCHTASFYTSKRLKEKSGESTDTRNEANDLVVACRTSEVRGRGRVGASTGGSGSTSARGRRHSRNSVVGGLGGCGTRWNRGRGTGVRSLASRVGRQRRSSRGSGGSNGRVGSSVGEGDGLGDGLDRAGFGTGVLKMLVYRLNVGLDRKRTIALSSDGRDEGGNSDEELHFDRCGIESADPKKSN